VSPAIELLARLRGDFDRSFAAPPPAAATALTDLLAIRVGGDPYAVRLADVSALVVDRQATPLPAAAPELLGVAGLRGLVVPVYDLATLLGYPGAPAPRWLVLAAGTPPVALAFDGVDGHLRVPPEAIAAPQASTGEVVRTADGVRIVVDLPSVRTRVTGRTESQ